MLNYSDYCHNQMTIHWISLQYAKCQKEGLFPICGKQLIMCRRYYINPHLTSGVGVPRSRASSYCLHFLPIQGSSKSRESLSFHHYELTLLFLYLLPLYLIEHLTSAVKLKTSEVTPASLFCTRVTGGFNHLGTCPPFSLLARSKG